mgnify:FL=1
MQNVTIGTIHKPITKSAAVTATGAGSAVVDLQDYQGIASIILNSGGIDDTDTSASPTCTVKLQTATDTAFSTAVDVTGGGFTAISTTAASSQELAIDLAGSTVNRYLRTYATVASEANATAYVGVVGLFCERGW